MQGHLQPLIGRACILRIFHDGQSFENHDPFAFVATVQFSDDGKTATIMGVRKDDPEKPVVTPEVFRAIRRTLEAAGVERAEFERHGKRRKKVRHVVLARAFRAEKKA